MINTRDYKFIIISQINNPDICCHKMDNSFRILLDSDDNSDDTTRDSNENDDDPKRPPSPLFLTVSKSDHFHEAFILFTIKYYNQYDSIILDLQEPSATEFNTQDLRISIPQYIKGLARQMMRRHAFIKPQFLLCSIIYMERIRKKTARGLIGHQTIRRFIIILLMISQKMWDDIPWNNAYFSSISGSYDLSLINNLELEILNILDYKLIITHNEFKQYLAMANDDYNSSKK